MPEQTIHYANSGGETPEASSTDAIKLLFNQHPIFCLMFGCLALYGLSMMAFSSSGDQEVDREREQRKQVRPERSEQVAPKAQKRKPDTQPAPVKAAPVVQKKQETVRVTKQVTPKQVVSAPPPVQVTQNLTVTVNKEETPQTLSAAQKKKDKKKKKKAEEAQAAPVVAAAPAKNTSIQNLAAGGRHGDDQWETVTGQRVILTKEERKQAQRKDSLDDETSESDSDVEAYKRKQRQAKKEVPVVVEAPKPVEKVNTKGPAGNTRSKKEEAPQFENLKKAKAPASKDKQEQAAPAAPQKQEQKAKVQKAQHQEVPPPQKKQEKGTKEAAPKTQAKASTALPTKSAPTAKATTKAINAKQAKKQPSPPKVEPKKPEPEEEYYDDEEYDDEGTSPDEEESDDGYDSESDEVAAQKPVIKPEVKYQAKAAAPAAAKKDAEQKFAEQFKKVKGQTSKLSKQGKQTTSEATLLKQTVEQGGFSTKPDRTPTLAEQHANVGRKVAVGGKQVTVLKPKKTLRANDGMGDWEVVDKRETTAVKKKNSDSDEASSFSSDEE